LEKGGIREQLKALPARAGVYLFKDGTGRVLYVGKAASLRHRVRSYLGAPRTLDPKTRKIMAATVAFDFIITDSEQEALILESNLIKKHRPRFNVRLKDDKSYPYIKISLNEEWPRVFLTRRFENDGGRYFGPFVNARSVHRTLDLLKRLFRYCSPRAAVTGKKSRPCFDFYEYRKIIDRVVLFLEGKHREVLRDLRAKMSEAAGSMEYERAARLRDQIQAVHDIAETQKITSHNRKDEDVIAFARERDEACVQIFFIRGGKVVGREHYIMEGTQDEEPGQVIAGFMEQFYGSASYVPSGILAQTEPRNVAVLRSWLADRRGRGVSISVPKRGERKKLVDMVADNAVQVLEQMKARWLADTGKTAAALQELESVLDLPGLPGRIECYDISNIRGTSAVGSMVVFEEGRPRPSGYRRFRIKTVDRIDDYAMMQEVLRRRFRRFESRAGGSWASVPGLVLIDGGRGHLTAAMEVMRELGIDSVPLAAIAKENEEIFLPGAAEPLILTRDSQALYLLQRVRDEAHRFALSYHLKVRGKSAVASALDIPGVGLKRRRALLNKFGSVKGIREAEIEEIAEVPGISATLAQSIKDSL